MAAVDVTLHATEKTDGDNRVEGAGTKGGSNLRAPREETGRGGGWEKRVR